MSVNAAKNRNRETNSELLHLPKPFFLVRRVLVQDQTWELISRLSWKTFRLLKGKFTQGYVIK